MGWRPVRVEGNYWGVGGGGWEGGWGLPLHAWRTCAHNTLARAFVKGARENETTVAVLRGRLCGGISSGEPAWVGLVVRAEGGKGAGCGVVYHRTHTRSPFSPHWRCIRRTIAICFPSFYSIPSPQKTKHVENVFEEKTAVVNAAGGRERRGVGLMRDRSPLFRLRRTQQESAVASGTLMEEGGRAGENRFID